jgi:acyl-CoA reductase-like NAD-dependent aldehyde dehydrogenase
MVQLTPGVINWPRVQATISGLGIELRGGGADEAPDAYYVQPAVVRMPSQSAVMQTETFAPILYVVDYADFDDYWEPFTGGAGPATGAFYASLDDATKATLRHTVRASLPEGRFTLPARAWIALGTVPS